MLCDASVAWSLIHAASTVILMYCYCQMSQFKKVKFLHSTLREQYHYLDKLYYKIVTEQIAVRHVAISYLVHSAARPVDFTCRSLSPLQTGCVPLELLVKTFYSKEKELGVA